MQENNNIDRINELVSSFFEKGLSEEERTELKKLLETPDNKRYFREVYTIELVARNMKPDNYLESAYDRVMGTIKEQSHNQPVQKKRNLMMSFCAYLPTMSIGYWKYYQKYISHLTEITLC